jgi:hypothetical protein
MAARGKQAADQDRFIETDSSFFGETEESVLESLGPAI